jgi:hypothetical protein
MVDDPKPSKRYITEVLAQQMVDDYMDEIDEKHRKIPYNWKDIKWKCRCGGDLFEEKEDLIVCLRCMHGHEIDIHR